MNTPLSAPAARPEQATLAPRYGLFPNLPRIQLTEQQDRQVGIALAILVPLLICAPTLLRSYFAE